MPRTRALKRTRLALAALTVITSTALSAAPTHAAPGDPVTLQIAQPVTASDAAIRVSPDLFGIHAITTRPSRIPGASSVRLWDTDTTWAVLNPAPGEYKWDTLDQRVIQAGNSHVLLVLGATPTWAATSVERSDASWLGPGNAAPPKDLRTWKEYVTAVAQRYKGRIDAYQVWNEPGIRMFWRGTSKQLAEMTRIAYDAVKAVDPQAEVVAPPITPRQRQWQGKARSLLEELKAQNWPVDAISFHGYPRGEGDPDVRVQEVQELQALMASKGVPSLPLWETEVNYASKLGKADQVTPSQARAWITRTYLDSVRLGIERSYWYAYADIPDFLQIDITQPETLKAYATLSSWLEGQDFHGCTTTPAGTSTVTACELRHPDRTASTILWASSPTVVKLPTGFLSDLAGGYRTTEATTTLTPEPVLYTAPRTPPAELPAA